VVVGDRRPDAEGAVLVTPLAPARRGNGLAMRAGLLLEALADAGPVDVVVVPVSGPAAGDAWLAATARRVVVVEPGLPRTRAEIVAALGDPARREELLEHEQLPARARDIRPELAEEACAALGGAPSTVVALRSYLAPFGTRLARLSGATRLVVDADDDDEALLRVQGDPRGADQHARLARQWFGQADRVLAASPIDAAAMSERYGIAVDTLPNAVARPAAATDPPGRDRILYVGNLTYAPNVEAVRDLVVDVIPALRALVPDVTVDVVGAHDERLADLAGHGGVTFTGAVPDVTPWYAGADVVVVPLRRGAGTRIKVLEAFAHRRPVVATPAAVSGLEVADGRSVHLGATAAQLAEHTARLLNTPGEARRTVEEADAVLSEHYLLDVVVPRARRLLTG
jgi:glycosyltransferase involved in cell wall biosynthesis